MSLKSLGLDFVDLYLMHWPCAMNPNGNDPKFPKLPDGSRDLDKSWSHIQTYKEMEKLVKTGKTKAIGVANYSKRYLEELLPEVEIMPAVNQIENHPLLPQQDIVDFCHEKGIHITAYSPLGSTGSPLMKNDIVMQIAKQTGVAPGNVLLSYHSKLLPPSTSSANMNSNCWTVARGNSVLAKSVTPSRIEENMAIIKLGNDEMAALDQISVGGVTRFVYPSFGVDFGFPDKQ
jgi:glycerol 2-dehydrogenase (NADP+)